MTEAVIRLLPFLAAAVLLASCGGGGSPPPPTEPPSAGLVVVFGADIRGTPSTFATELDCAIPDGDVPDPAASCRDLAGQPDLLVSPEPGGTLCDRPPTEWGVEVTGVYQGRRVDARFDRCHPAEVARWMRVMRFEIPVPGV